VDARRIVIKIGSSSLTRPDGHLDVGALERLVELIADRRSRGLEVVLVSSGAVAAGIGPLRLQGRPADIAVMQAAAMVGQGQLIAEYTARFADHGIAVAQLLLTAEDTMRRAHYRNAVRALETLLGLGAVPIINENDGVVTDELRFGDNDRLAALVAQLVRADALLLLTDVDALYDGPPSREGARRIPHVASLAEVAEVDVSGSGSKVGTGGMVTKLQSVAIATSTAIPVVLTSAANAGAALAGEDVGTWFEATGRRSSRRRVWLEYAARSRGRILLDAGAVRALERGGASLLPAGITGVEGDFAAGDPVELAGPDGEAVARGISAFDAAELPGMLGRSTHELRDELGEGYDREVVHRDDLVLVRRR